MDYEHQSTPGTYNDHAYCPYYEHCKNGVKCPIALTRAVKESARFWWEQQGGKGEAPLSRHIDIPQCFEGH